MKVPQQISQYQLVVGRDDDHRQNLGKRRYWNNWRAYQALESDILPSLCETAMAQSISAAPRIAILVDCDNIASGCLPFAMTEAAKFGRAVIRRGYGNHATLTEKWQKALTDHGFMPCLQYQLVAGKNTADIALALDALEAVADDRADVIFVVTSDSDFSVLCRKLRERGAMVCIVGEAKSSDALRNAADQFFAWKRIAAKLKTAPPKPAAKHRPLFLVEIVTSLTGGAPNREITLQALGTYLKRSDPSFSPRTYGHSTLRKMVETYDLLSLRQTDDRQWLVCRVDPDTPCPDVTEEVCG